MTEKVSKYILERNEIAHPMFVEFATECLTDGRPVPTLGLWRPLGNNVIEKLPTS